MATWLAGRAGPRTKPWRARAVRQGKSYSLGYYRTRREAEAVEEAFDRENPPPSRGRLPFGNGRRSGVSL